MRIFVGVDGGKQGAIACIYETSGSVETWPMPVLKAATKKGKASGRTEYDWAGIVALVDELRRHGREPFFTVEKAQPMPPTVKGGAIANFNRGVQRAWEPLLIAKGIPFQLVAPRTWQALLHAGTPAGDTKQRSIIAAQRLFPGVSLKRSERARKDDDGIAEALLLASYGQRTYRGG